MSRPGDASGLSDQERKAWADRVRAHFEAQRARGEDGPPPTPEEVLEELERDDHAGRHQKIDFRLSAEEKLLYAQAAQTWGITTSEWMRQVLAQAAQEALAPEPVEA